MKKLLLLTLILMFPVLIAAQQAPGADLHLSILKYEPVPARPGDSLDIWLKLDNAGADIEKGLKLEFIDNYPFSLESDDRRIHTIRNLAGGYDYVAKFKVRVSPDAPIGTSYTKARFIYSSEDRWTDEFLPIDIEWALTTLKIDSITLEPEKLEPGENGKVKIKVTNNANSIIRDVVIKTDVKNSGAPIAPISSSTELKIDSLEAGMSHVFEFNFIAELDAEANAYTIPINVSFGDERGNTNSYTDLVGIVISAEPELVLTIDSSDVYVDQKNGRVTLKFVNKGVDEIKFLWIDVLPSTSYELLSPTSKYYVGNIDSDDYEVEEIMVKALEDDELEIPLMLEYRDSSNRLYKVDDSVVINLVNKEDIEGKESKTGRNFFYLIIVAAVGYYFWRKRKKAKE